MGLQHARCFYQGFSRTSPVTANLGPGFLSQLFMLFKKKTGIKKTSPVNIRRMFVQDERFIRVQLALWGKTKQNGSLVIVYSAQSSVAASSVPLGFFVRCGSDLLLEGLQQFGDVRVRRRLQVHQLLLQFWDLQKEPKTRSHLLEPKRGTRWSSGETRCLVFPFWFSWD